MGCLCWAGLAVRLNKRADSWFAIAIHQAEKREEGKEWSSCSGLCLSDTSLCMCCCFFPLKAGRLCVCFYVFTGTCVVVCMWTVDPAFKCTHKDVVSILWRISSSILLLINHWSFNYDLITWAVICHRKSTVLIRIDNIYSIFVPLYTVKLLKVAKNMLNVVISKCTSLFEVINLSCLVKEGKRSSKVNSKK